MDKSIPRVSITEAAQRLLETLKEEHGDLLFHQSGGCCDGSAPMCYRITDFRIGTRDVCLGEVAGCWFYIGHRQYELWKHTHLTLDLVEGRGAGFSLEAPLGVRFLTRSRVFSTEELEHLEPVHIGPKS